MPRKSLIYTDKYFYHITTRTKHMGWFKIPLEEVWDISIKAFLYAQEKRPVAVSQYVLMANHYHMLVRTPNCDLDLFIYNFNKKFNGLLEDEFTWGLITNERYFKNVHCYIYQNPLRAKVVDRCEDYPYSTLFYSSRHLQNPFPFVPLEHLESDLDSINSCLVQPAQKLFCQGLVKTYF